MQAVYKFKKICLIMDKASQHRATKIRELVERTDGLEIIFLPTATPDLSAIETYWRDLKRAVLDVSYTSLRMLREAITRYTRYKKPNLVVENFLYRDLRRHQTTMDTHAGSVCHARCSKPSGFRTHARSWTGTRTF